MDDSRRIQCLSYGLYRIVNDIVGPERVIQMRRTVTNLSNDYRELHSILSGDLAHAHLSGSNAEGFRFTSSDKDVMFVVGGIIVTEHSDIDNHRSDELTVLQMETEQCRPGFALLKLRSPSRHLWVSKSRVLLTQGVYVSSMRWKEAIPTVIPNGGPHGPCQSGMAGETELDFAFCLRCHNWPNVAVGCITRLQNIGWLDAAVVTKILKEGCHLVAIGAKGSNYEDLEWRISYSFAEKTLIHNMNHCQFLCYGLLKIFLKEAIENSINGEKLLCSYFLKTAVFWEICNQQTVWNSTIFLSCFRACFRRLIYWVYNGYCPNFFIPENNMFFGKIKGRAQSALLSELTMLYSEGYCCLLKCPSIQRSFSALIYNPLITLSLQRESESYSNSRFCLEMILEIIHDMPRGHISDVKDIQYLREGLSRLELTVKKDNENIILNTWKRYAAQYWTIHHSYDANLNNVSKHDTMCHILRNLKANSIDMLNHNLLSAVYLYRCGFFNKAVDVLLHAKSKLRQPNMMYFWNLREDKYKAAGGEHTPLVTMMRRVVAEMLDVPMDICVLELKMEHQAAGHCNNSLSYSPFVISEFLLYLSYLHLRQITEVEAILENLSVLVTYDEGDHIHHTHRAISWTMLGICQEMSGQLTNALQSYTEALRSRNNEFEDATRDRILNVVAKINSA